MAKNDMEHSPVRATMEFPPPPVFYNPWGEMGDFSSMYGGPPPFDDEDLGGRVGSDGEDEEDVLAADTPHQRGCWRWRRRRVVALAGPPLFGA